MAKEEATGELVAKLTAFCFEYHMYKPFSVTVDRAGRAGGPHYMTPRVSLYIRDLSREFRKSWVVDRRIGFFVEDLQKEIEERFKR